MDDLYIILWNPLVHSIRGVWGAFAAPYWPPDLGGHMYRPLPLATFALDWSLVHGHPAWFHAMNLLWHAGTAVAVTAMVRRWSGIAAAVVAGAIFAVHPVHVEAVANVVGRARHDGGTRRVSRGVRGGRTRQRPVERPGPVARPAEQGE